MQIQIAISFKRFVTIGTDERLLASVTSAMHFQTATFFERLVTIRIQDRRTASRQCDYCDVLLGRNSV